MTTAVYAGTFDPFTYGHMSVVTQACRIFSHVRILVAVNEGKKPLLDKDMRVDVVRSYVSKMPNVTVDFDEGLVAKYAEQVGATFLVRGVRNLTDAGAELLLAEQNKKIAPHIQTVLLPADPALSDVSSSAVKRRRINFHAAMAHINQFTYLTLMRAGWPETKSDD